MQISELMKFIQLEEWKRPEDGSRSKYKYVAICFDYIQI